MREEKETKTVDPIDVIVYMVGAVMCSIAVGIGVWELGHLLSMLF